MQKFGALDHEIYIYIYIYIFSFQFFYSLIYIYIYIYISWPILVESDPKTLFSIATTRKLRGELYFSWNAPLTLDSYLIKLSVKQGGIKYYFLSIWYDSIWD